MLSLVALVAVVFVAQDANEPPATRGPTVEALAPAAAASPAQEPAPLPARWYGSPALIADGAAVAVGVAGFSARNEGIFFLAGTAYLLAGPINHLVNHRPGAAIGSFFLRALASGVAAGVYVADVLAQGCDGDPGAGHPCEYNQAALLGGLVLAGAVIADDILLAREPPRRAVPARVSWTPALLVAPNLGLVSLGGTF
jgi:hypothetical protein